MGRILRLRPRATRWGGNSAYGTSAQNTDGRLRTFGNFGRMKLMLESSREIVENDPMYRVPRAQ